MRRPAGVRAAADAAAVAAPQQLAAVLLCCGRLVGRCEGWADIAGALTLNGTHHVFQGCPTAGGWHHAASRDLVHFEDRGIHLRAIKESYEGMVSDSPPCSGFVTVDDAAAMRWVKSYCVQGGAMSMPNQRCG